MRVRSLLAALAVVAAVPSGPRASRRRARPADYNDWSDYGTEFATAPQLGSDGRLLESNRVASGGALRSNAGADQCRSAMASSSKPQVTPGTYYWQVIRLCVACPGDYETSAVRRFTVRTAPALTVAAPARAYEGCPAVLSLRAKGVPDGGRMRVERPAGSAWRSCR